MTSPYARKAGRAVKRVQHAVKAGTLTRQPCADCGETRVEGHHLNGYDADHELDVIWLCRVHHMQRHRRSVKPSWERGARAYIERTRPSWLGAKSWTYAENSGPKRLFLTLERAWTLLRTDEERAYAAALMHRLMAPTAPVVTP